jgi:hypothetical protein
MKTYRMCGLAQNNQRSIGWIEDRGAKLGARVEIDELGGFWTVTGVGETAMTREELTNKQRADRASCSSIK